MRIFWFWLMENGGILMGFISGIFAAFREDRKGRLWTILPIAGVIVGLVWALASANFADREEQAKMEEAITKVDTYVTSQSEKSVGEISQNTLRTFQQYLGALPSVAKATSPEKGLENVRAAISANNIIGGLPIGNRGSLTIHVFNHVQQEVNYQFVKARLLQMAREVDLLAPVQNEAATNSVWWSDGASLDEAKAAALIVTSAGLQIRQICPAELIRTKGLIQIGGSIGIETLPILSIPKIQQLTSPVCAQSSLNSNPVLQ
jgi:hypothetical protein